MVLVDSNGARELRAKINWVTQVQIGQQHAGKAR